ncbi:MAG TPA: NAD-dependent succinate-semialdehyde dehydrogenase [Trebonia sp.]|nr:NAD-dependent succinate-semialdehyde dehydrogenase [Trebonia sp.]
MLYGKLYIDGQWRESRDRAVLDVHDPATGLVMGHAAAATPADVTDALDAAGRAAPGWRDADPWQRSAVLRRAAALLAGDIDGLSQVLSGEQGKPRGEARAELMTAAEIIDWCADEARRIYGRTIPARSPGTRLLVTRHAVGPVAAFTASNFPALLPARKLGAALAAGCPVVLKPAEQTPFTALRIAGIFHEAGLPAGVLNVVTGDPAPIADQLLASPVIGKISLTGSVPVGKRLLAAAADRVLPASMELGGHAAGLVFADADLDATADAIVAGKWRNCGQVCIALSRLFVQQPVLDKLTEMIASRMAGLRVGPASDPASQVGPLLDEKARGRAEALLADAVAAGGRVLAGGRRPPHRPEGYFYEPTLVSGAGPRARIWREEPFGPVLPVAPFTDLADGLERANETPFGLSSFVFTRDLETAMRASDGLECGMVGVNSLVIATAEAPAGGIGESGFGREGGSEALTDYTVTKYVNIRL